MNTILSHGHREQESKSNHMEKIEYQEKNHKSFLIQEKLGEKIWNFFCNIRYIDKLTL